MKMLLSHLLLIVVVVGCHEEGASGAGNNPVSSEDPNADIRASATRDVNSAHAQTNAIISDYDTLIRIWNSTGSVDYARTTSRSLIDRLRRSTNLTTDARDKLREIGENGTRLFRRATSLSSINQSLTRSLGNFVTYLGERDVDKLVAANLALEEAKKRMENYNFLYN